MELLQENLVKYIQILQNSMSAGAPPRTPLGSLWRSPDPLLGWGGDTSSHCPSSQRLRRLSTPKLDAFGVSLSTPLASRLGAFDAEKRILKVAPKPNFWTRPWF